jgi:hypothetical protein
MVLMLNWRQGHMQKYERARDLLDHLAKIGATVEPAGDRLILRAGPTGIPASLVGRVRKEKADLIAALAAPEVRGSHEAQTYPRQSGCSQCMKQTTEASVVKWLNDHPAPSEPGRCVWCHKPHSPSAVVIPFGDEPGGHTWLHVECWPAWHQARRAKAAAELHVTLQPS